MLKNLPVHAGEFKTRRVQNRDYIVIILALEVLVARHKTIEGKALKVLGEEGRRLHLGIHCLRKILSKSQPEMKELR